MIILTIEQFLRYICTMPHKNKDILFVTDGYSYCNSEYIKCCDTIRAVDEVGNSIYCSITSLANSLKEGTVKLFLSKEFAMGFFH